MISTALDGTAVNNLNNRFTHKCTGEDIAGNDQRILNVILRISSSKCTACDGIDIQQGFFAVFCIVKISADNFVN